MAKLETAIAFDPGLLVLQLFGESSDFYTQSATVFDVAGETQGFITPVISAFGDNFTFENGGANGSPPDGGVISGLQVGAFVGPQYEFGFSVSGLELSAAKFADVVLSESLADDRALVEQIFSGADELVGSRKGDVLDGFAGIDTLEGGGGKDVFRFSQKAGGANADLIIDFKSGSDVIELSGRIFTKARFDEDGLSKKSFVVGEEAEDRNDRVIYNDDTGELFYDKNGSERGGQKLIAILDPDVDLSRGDFDLFTP
jgi:hypothetical protein